MLYIAKLKRLKQELKKSGSEAKVQNNNQTKPNGGCLHLGILQRVKPGLRFTTPVDT